PAARGGRDRRRAVGRAAARDQPLAPWETPGMTTAEVPLTGGNASADVVRAGDTVRKPWQPATPAVHRFMATVRSAGVDVPQTYGQDERGRQVLEHVPG